MARLTSSNCHVKGGRVAIIGVAITGMVKSRVMTGGVVRLPSLMCTGRMMSVTAYNNTHTSLAYLYI